jgi:chromosome segregation ATPase
MLPPITSSSPDTALQVYAAKLQHDVSVQKIALSTVQGEHDKLLAAFSRSQTRASTLEKKHAVSDGEIISLTEEKIRLQAQVIELEQNVEELAQSRDEARQAAVQAGAQYVKIVKMASQLEEKTGKERKIWNKLKTEMEQRIKVLSSGSSKKDDLISGMIDSSVLQIGETTTSPSSVEVREVVVDEVVKTTSAESQSIASTSQTPATMQGSTDELKQEIERLRKRCAEVENALRTVRDDSRSMDSTIRALTMAGKGILDRVDGTLGVELVHEN